MFELEQKAYSAAQPILNDLSSVHVAVAAVVDGSIEGEVWVDDQKEPSVAVVVNADTRYVAGNPDALAAHSGRIKILVPDWAYLFVDEPWEACLGRVWNNPFALRHPRIRMGQSADWQLPPVADVPAGFTITPIDQSLLQSAPGNVDVLEEMIEGWHSPDFYFQHAVGFCVLHDGKIVSHGATDSVCGRRGEVGVGTEPGFRRLGLGRAAVAATVAECVKRGIDQVEWHTHASNKGSIAIARAIGFVERDRHVAYSSQLPAENVGDLTPSYCRELGQQLESASAHIGWLRFQAAGAWALAGERERALENTRRLVDEGWEGEAEWLEEYWAVQSLAADPEFQAIVARQRLMHTE